MTAEVRTRFAPSPTGHLHVGGARTALFNYLFARHHKGKFLLRIEDTDKARSDEAMTRQILDSLRWLGLDWDEEVFFQGAHAEEHREHAKILLSTDHAYPCFCSKEVLEEERRRASAEKRAFRYPGTCRNLTTEEVQEKMAAGLPFAVRFKVPEGITAWEDGVHGKIEVKNSEIDDFIIQRSDGSPIYQLAVVVDDHTMGVTHVIRGDDHTSNTPKQLLLYRAFDWQPPQFSHVPLILGRDKKRLSKRHGATSVEEYRVKGFQPETMVNYLALLGWSPGDNREILSLKELIELFSIEGIQKKGAVFDENKLIWMNGQYLSRIPDKELLLPVMKQLVRQKLISRDEVKSRKKYVLEIIRLLKPRVKWLQDIVESGLYFFRDPRHFDTRGLKKYFKEPETWTYLSDLIPQIQKMPKYNEATLESLMRHYAEEHNISAAKIIHPVRLALTGMTFSPGLFEVMVLLGHQTVVRRLKAFVKHREILTEQMLRG